MPLHARFSPSLPTPASLLLAPGKLVLVIHSPYSPLPTGRALTASFGSTPPSYHFLTHRAHSFFSFPLPTPSAHPPGLSPISSSHHHTSTLASPSLTVIYPAHEHKHPAIPSPGSANKTTPPPQPKLHHTYCHGFVVVLAAHLAACYATVCREGRMASRAASLRTDLVSIAVVKSSRPPFSFPISPVDRRGGSYAFTRRYDDAALVTHALTLHQVLP
jgi:hypothetical protein